MLHYPLMFLGIKLSAGISSVAIAVQLYAPFSVLIAALFLRERVGRRRLLGLALAFGGVVVIGFEPSVYERLTAFFCVVGGALSMGLAIVLIARTQGIPILTLQAWMALMSLGPLLLLSLAFEGNPAEALAGAGWLQWATVAYTAIVGTIHQPRRLVLPAAHLPGQRGVDAAADGTGVRRRPGHAWFSAKC